MSPYKLPELSYDYKALEPMISARILELHHDKHHAAYVENANQTLVRLDEMRAKQDFTGVAALERALAFNLSGHILHSILWCNLSPACGSPPKGELAETINRDFGSYAVLKKYMQESAGTIMGSGWAALVWEPVARRLLVTQIYDHQSNLSQAGVPLLVIDAWEHAYYLQYEDRKHDYLAAIWEVIDFQDVAQRFRAARASEVDLVEAASRSGAQHQAPNARHF